MLQKLLANIMNENVVELRSGLRLDPDAETKTMNASLAIPVRAWVRKMAFLHEVSASAVVEVALFTSCAVQTRKLAKS